MAPYRHAAERGPGGDGAEQAEIDEGRRQSQSGRNGSRAGVSRLRLH